MRWGSMDFQQLKALQGRLQAGPELDALARSVLEELGNRLLAQTKRKTPVKTGHLRRNWLLTGVSQRGGWYEVELYNNVAYAAYVENGHRRVGRDGSTLGWSEGAFMLRSSAQALERQLPALLERRTNAFLKGLSEGGA